MWLLHTTSGELKWFAKRPAEGYLILSHVWTTEEQTFQDVQALKAAGGLSVASSKIRDCCAFARRRGYNWAWIDTCCIDKTSSAELSEAINSMFAWYRHADECIAFLQDVDETEDPYAEDSQFRQSRWYTRGWTLQELIAPRRLVFVSKNWRVIGTKGSLAGLVEEITNVDFDVLTFRRTHARVSVARRMSWAANRQTTREEDRAYSLLGIFGVSIATVYGEGDNAFIRLQEEIMKHIPDQSIFAWGPPMLRDISAFSRTVSSPGKRHLRALLSISPDSFANSAEVVPVPPEMVSKRLGIKVPPLHFTLTSYGMHALVPMMKAPGSPSDKPVWLAVLACADGTGNLVALILQPQSEEAEDRFFVGVSVFVAQQLHTGALHCDDYRSVSLDLAPGRTFPWSSSVAKMREVHIPHRLDTFNFDYAHEGKRPARDKRRWSDIIVAPCEVVIPAWHVHKLSRESGFALKAPNPGDSSLFFEDGCYEPQEIQLANATTEDILVVRLAPCSTDAAFQYLHASVFLQDPNVRDVVALAQSNSDDTGCASEHVSRWEQYTKRFDLGRWKVTLVFETLNSQFSGLVNPEHNGRALHSLRLDIAPSAPPASPMADSEKTIGAHDQLASRPSTAASSSFRDEFGKASRSQLPKTIEGTGGWKYWDGRMGHRPPAHTDAVTATPTTTRRKFSATTAFRRSVQDLVWGPSSSS
ncbi:HET-domain-containing protein [Lentinus tigrinus ALCF2SS1-7]|uniref:HET-domain-containing protein n=1 Tax=Lentinus tigrinus ALCF2SS1-6 TaxID=1328759 RepID=A0A5C2SAE5_9APHY|nr:HET-domain-containing protein [Lentinus tigrinus ALCF2SS1-6]RPD72906.1 HET-domain-containing protein [Lentinus tigrinus ALCF2SS1-7]